MKLTLERLENRNCMASYYAFPGGLTAGLSQLSEGDTLYLHGGQYEEQIYDSVSNITIMSVPGEIAIIPGATIRVTNHVTLRTLEITGAGDYKTAGVGFQSDGNRLENCYVHGNYHGIVISQGADNNVVIGSIISNNNPGFGIYIGPNDERTGNYDNQLINNIIFDNNTGIAINAKTHNTKVIGNYVTNNSWENLRLTASASGTQVIGNTFWREGIAGGNSLTPEINPIWIDNKQNVDAFFAGWSGEESIAVGDFNNDGQFDLAVGAGYGAGPHVKVFDNKLQEQFSFFAFDQGFRGGLSVASGDVNQDGISDFIIGAGPGADPHVIVYSIAHGSLDIVHSFFAFDRGFHGGVLVSFDNGNIKVIAGQYGNGHIKVFDGVTLNLLQSYFAA
jgi:parallel beta-helix repeat protein